MSAPIAIFHHSRISGGEPCIQFDHASAIVAEQILALNQSGLAAAANELYFGVNGGAEDAEAVEALTAGFDWYPKVKVIAHPDDAKGEHPTLRLLQEWCRTHGNWYVMYEHTKAATAPGNEFYASWRRCMERVCVHNWERCIADLDRGFDTVGPHFLTPEQYPGVVNHVFYGGNFWWARAEFILTLPMMEPTAKDRAAMFDAESLIGRGPRRPNAARYANHWPGGECSQ